MKIRCGTKYDTYGTIEATETGYVYEGQETVLKQMVVVTQDIANTTHPPDVLRAMSHVFHGYIWARKFNEHHDERGRFASGDGGGSSSTSDSPSSGVSTSKTSNSTLLKSIIETGGFTYSPLSGMPKEGLALSIYPEHSAVVNAANIKGSDLQGYMDSKRAVLKDPTNYVGAWHDTQSGKVYLDISKVLPPTAHDQAVALSKQYGQRAYWDIGNQKEIRVVDEAHAHQAASRANTEETKAKTHKKVVLQAMLSGKETEADLELVAQAIRDRQAAYDAANKDA